MKSRISLILLLVLVAIFTTACSDYTKGKVCGTHTETYNSEVKGCDKQPNCKCLHEAFFGLGACDSCSCTRQVSNC